MKNFKKSVLKGIVLVLLVLCITVTWFVLEILLPHRTLSSPDWWIPIGEGKYAPNRKTRNACHAVLRYQFTYHNDAVLALRYVGDKDSIPYLIQALKLQNVKHPSAITSDKRAPVTFMRCLGSLEQLTGMKLGRDYKTWENWWKETGQYLPFDEEKGQLILQEGTE